MSGPVWIGFVILLTALFLEVLAPKRLAEGFQALVPVNEKEKDGNFLTQRFVRRGDVGPDKEWKGYIQDPRYFHGYADVQRIGKRNDFCRVVLKEGDGSETFFACGLAGTKADLSPYTFRTRSVAKGLKLSRDDYMRDIVDEGREAYCRILKDRDGEYKPLCLRATDTGFHPIDVLDENPPEEIKTLVDFYSGCRMWLRLRDDMVDYLGNAILQTAGGITLDHTPNPEVTRGLFFNGQDQFVRLGDTNELSLGNKIPLRKIRAFSVWAYFDAFTNNAHIFDFGDGPGLNNIFLGILGKGEVGDVPNELRPGPKCAETTVPTGEVGAQWCPEIRAEELLKTSAANVDEYSCVGPELQARRLAPIQTRIVQPEAGATATRATLIFEIWDKRLRKVQIKVNRAIPLKKWVQITVTTTSTDSLRPTYNVYINGTLMHVLEDGFLPQAATTSNNYLGKSNWVNYKTEYENQDELFSGSLFDFRMYETPISDRKVKRIVQWGASKLGLDTSFESVVG